MTTAAPDRTWNIINPLDWSKPIMTITAYYQYLREKALADAAERRNQVVARIPAIEKIEESLRQRSVDISRVMVTGGRDKTLQMDQLKREIDRLTHGTWKELRRRFP